MRSIRFEARVSRAMRVQRSTPCLALKLGTPGWHVMFSITTIQPTLRKSRSRHMMTVYVSGLHSGPSPSAGVGTARAIRAAFPHLRLVGVDYWHGSSGLHHDVFDGLWLLPSWDYLDRDAHAEAIRRRLDDGAFFISTLDLEIRWLTEAVGAHHRLLVPKLAALQPTLKPAPLLTDLLPFAVP